MYKLMKNFLDLYIKYGYIFNNFYNIIKYIITKKLYNNFITININNHRKV